MLCLGMFALLLAFLFLVFFMAGQEDDKIRDHQERMAKLRIEEMLARRQVPQWTIETKTTETKEE